jgi:hypothetical protein
MPLVPQVKSLDDSHVGPEQQPLAQVVELHPMHTPPEHVAPPQFAQAVPAEPQAVLEFPLRQTPPAEQHPPGHEVESQTHDPLEHSCPLEQAAPVPQVQEPLVLHPSPDVPQPAQAMPGGLQLTTERTVQVEPVQHPPGHDIALHTQLPAEHTCPLPQDGPLPQTHAPVTEQPSEVMASHATQVAPPTPHVFIAEVVQVVPEEPPQQPLGHDVELHTHTPEEQTCPEPHAGPEPHWQTPLLGQLSAVVELHATQAAPLAPQAPSEAVLQTVPEQQPLQLEAQPLQAPPVQVCGDGHERHELPPLPQAEAALPPMQLLPMQHPAQDLASQTHAPPRHSCPFLHAGPVPHAHPPALHVSPAPHA